MRKHGLLKTCKKWLLRVNVYIVKIYVFEPDTVVIFACGRLKRWDGHTFKVTKGYTTQ